MIECKESRIGKQPVKVADGITVTLKPGSISCKVLLEFPTEQQLDPLLLSKQNSEQGTRCLRVDACLSQGQKGEMSQTYDDSLVEITESVRTST